MIPIFNIQNMKYDVNFLDQKIHTSSQSFVFVQHDSVFCKSRFTNLKKTDLDQNSQVSKWQQSKTTIINPDFRI